MKIARIGACMVSLVLVGVSCDQGTPGLHRSANHGQIRVIALNVQDNQSRSIDLFKGNKSQGRVIVLDPDKVEQLKMEKGEASLLVQRGKGMILMPGNKGIPLEENELIFLPEGFEGAIRAQKKQSTFLVIYSR